MAIKKSAELKAKIASKVAKRGDVKKSEPALEIAVWASWMAYLKAAVQALFQALEGPDGVRPTHLQIVADDEKTNCVYFISCGSEDEGAEEIKRRSNGAGSVHVHAALDKFDLKHIPGHKMLFTCHPDPNTEYGPAVVMPISSLKWVKMRATGPRKKKQTPDIGDTAGDKAAATNEPKQ